MALQQFPDTQWSLIRRSGETPSVRDAAFSELVRRYRGAVLAWFRAQMDSADAEDATQGFLVASFERDWWARADPSQGSFRTFLMVLMRRHLWRLQHGNATDAVMVDALDELADASPDAARQFDARFVLDLTARAIEDLRTQYAQRGREVLFEALLQWSAGAQDHGALKALAERLGIPANTLTIEMRRWRQRLRDQVRSELRALCADEGAFAADWAAIGLVLRT